jgi:23S rRNA pseudouridine2605 synthase
MIRLQKILSAAGVASRRAAETMIREGRVSVNGRTVTELGTRADPEHDDIRVDGHRIRSAVARRYLLLNKPRGYVTTRSDPQHRRTIMALVEREREYLYPVGRLDYDSEGLIILTNDGDLAARLMHPRHGIDRVYEARVRGVPDRDDLQRFARGMTIDGRRTAPARARVVETGRGARADQSVLEITLHEGRTRQVRKMCDAIGHPVVRLKRVRIGPIADPALASGEYRELRPDEVRRLQKAAALPLSDAHAGGGR